MISLRSAAKSASIVGSYPILSRVLPLGRLIQRANVHEGLPSSATASDCSTDRSSHSLFSSSETQEDRQELSSIGVKGLIGVKRFNKASGIMRIGRAGRDRTPHDVESTQVETTIAQKRQNP